MEVQNFSDQYDKPQIAYSNFGIRLGAQVIDNIIVFIIFALIFVFILAGIFSGSEPEPTDAEMPFWAVGVILYYLFGVPASALIYRSIFEASKYQATPGKMICSLKVVDKHWERLSLLQSIGRNLSKIFSSFLFIGYLMALGGKECRTLHDHMANTYVIMK